MHFYTREELMKEKKTHHRYSAEGILNLVQNFTGTNTHEEAIADLIPQEEVHDDDLSEQFKNQGNDWIEKPYKCLCGKKIKKRHVYYSKNKSKCFLIGDVCINTMEELEKPPYNINVGIFTRSLKEECKVCRELKILKNKEYKNDICYDVCKDCRINYSSFRCSCCSRNQVEYFKGMTDFVCKRPECQSYSQPYIFLNISYYQKDKAKPFGIRWSPQRTGKHCWFTTKNNYWADMLIEKYGLKNMN